MQSVVGVAMVPEAILEKLEPMHAAAAHMHIVLVRRLSGP